MEERALAAVASAEVAEEVASSAMRAAGAGVQDEMEAAAVVKETQAALSKALRQVKSIMPAEELASVEEERAAQLCALDCIHTLTWSSRTFISPECVTHCDLIGNPLP